VATETLTIRLELTTDDVQANLSTAQADVHPNYLECPGVGRRR
jgi:hypothetical protein